MWFIDKITQIAQYALGQANAPYVMQVDPQGNPLASTTGALNTFETAAIGYDPSTGRTPVEQTNNIYSKAATANVAESIKSAPGFVHTISCSALWSGSFTTPTHVLLTLYDAVSATNPVLVKRVPAVVSLGSAYASFDIVLDGIFATGIYISIATADGGGVLTSTNTTVTYR